jgi:hypothetical protein
MLKLKDSIVILLIVCGITLVGNFVGFKINPIEAIPGMLILLGTVILGLVITKIMPGNLPAILYVSIVGIIITIPGFPGAAWFTAQANKVQFLALTTPVLAYAGIASGKDLGDFKKLGWRIVVVSVFVFIGTYVSSAFIAQLTLKLMNQI